MSKKVLFVGAGPVGLFTAIQLKLLNPDADITMLEKYEEYQRNHPLFIDPSSFADSCPDEGFQTFLKKLPKTMRTNELEKLLLDYAKELGINIEYRHVLDCPKLKEEYPDTRFFVGSDGSHSEVQKQIFGEQYQIKKTLQYIAEIKYEVEGPTRYLNTFMEAIPATTYAEHFVSEFVGRENEGKKTPVSLRIFIDEETHKQMQTATFKNPFRLTQPEKIHPALLRSITTWLHARETMAGEKRTEGSEKITVTHLPVYASQEFVKNEDDAIWFVVGDAAFGMPFFRSLNNGILCSSQLAKALDALLKDELLLDMPPTEAYKAYVQKLVEKEDFTAELKNMGVNSLGATAACSQNDIGRTVVGPKLVFFGGGRNFKRRMKDEEEKNKAENKKEDDETSTFSFSRGKCSVS